MIVTIVSAMMRYCVMAQLHLAESEPKVTNPAFSLEVQTRRRVFWSAYALDRFISWIYHIPNNIIDEHISVQVSHSNLLIQNSRKLTMAALFKCHGCGTS